MRKFDQIHREVRDTHPCGAKHWWQRFSVGEARRVFQLGGIRAEEALG